MKITSKSTIEEVATIVSEALSKAGIEAVLTGGAVVSIYSKNEFQSWDLDFITPASAKRISEVMTELEFKQEEGRHFRHPKTKFFVEFPSPPLAIGDEPVKEWATKRSEAGSLLLLTPTYCVMDRLAAFYHWKDNPSLQQAVAVATKQPVNLSKLKDWSKREGQDSKFKEFSSKLKEALNKSKGKREP